QGAWQWAVACYVLASIAYFWGNVFGDSMLVSVAPPGKLDRTSAIGYFAGYLGGGIFLALGVAMTLKPQWFGLASAAEAVQLLLVLAAAWWALFALPLLFWVPSPPKAAAHVPFAVAAREGLTQFMETFRHIRGYKPVFVFLAAYWVYIDGVNTVIQMAVDYGKSIGFGTSDLILAVLLVQFVGLPAALGAGRLGELPHRQPAPVDSLGDHPLRNRRVHFALRERTDAPAPAPVAARPSISPIRISTRRLSWRPRGSSLLATG